MDSCQEPRDTMLSLNADHCLAIVLGSSVIRSSWLTRLSPVRWLLPYNWASMCQEELYRKSDFDAADWISECFDWVIYPAGCLRGTVKLPFEDMELPCPAGYDEYLTTVYGDWRQPPPEGEREPAHPVAWFSLDRSYRDRWWER